MNTPTPSSTPSLTAFPPGSIKELSVIAIPLMLSSLSAALMLFFDRLIVGYYSTTAMNAIAATGTVFAAFQFGVISLATIAEVFVGQHNGAKQFDKIARPVWQMIWFSIMTAVIFWPMAYFGQDWLVTAPYQELGSPYFFWIMCFGPFFGIGAALSAYFIGQGRSIIVTLCVVIGTILNIILDIYFVFGIPGLLAPMGTKGAAIASGIAQVSIALILLILFLRPKERLRCATHRCAFHWETFKRCMSIGLPSSTGHIMAIAAWGFAAHIIAHTGEVHMTLFTIGQTVWILLSFSTEGLSKGVTATASNLIGSNQIGLAKKSMTAGIKMALLSSLLVGIPLLIIPDILILPFLDEVSPDFPIVEFVPIMRLAFVWIWFCYLMDGTIWSIAGLLTAAGDTRFQMVWMTLATWLLCVVPMWYFVGQMESPPIRIQHVLAFYIACDTLAFYLRYKQGAWVKKAKLI